MHHTSPRSKSCPRTKIPALTQTPLWLNSFNIFSPLSLHLFPTNGSFYRKTSGLRNKLTKWILSNFHTAVCLHFCIVLNDRSVPSCRYMQLLINSLWKLLSLIINPDWERRGGRSDSRRPHGFIVLTYHAEFSLEVALQAHSCFLWRVRAFFVKERGLVWEFYFWLLEDGWWV